MQSSGVRGYYVEHPSDSRCRVQGLLFVVQGLGCVTCSSGCRGTRPSTSLKMSSLGFRVYGFGSMVHCAKEENRYWKSEVETIHVF